MKDLHILAIMSTYNEIDFLPLKIAWCKANGLDLYVCDNMSTDGTWQMLQSQNIPSHQYDTDGMFSEIRMQSEIKKTLDMLKPDWVVYMGCDLFFATFERLGLSDAIQFANQCEFSVIRTNFFSARYTGEERILPFNPFANFNYVKVENTLDFIFKYHKDVVFNGDNLSFPYPESSIFKYGAVINYGDTKPANQRFETLMRKRKAWDKGENPGLGEHYISGYELNWTWNCNDLLDIRTSYLETLIRSIQKDCGLC